MSKTTTGFQGTAQHLAEITLSWLQGRTMTKTALITGATGQDGSYLAELLLSKGYRVVGLVRRHSVPEQQASRIAHLEADPNFSTRYGDLTDPYSLNVAIECAKPDLVFNLASMSHVRVSFDVPQFTVKVNAAGVLNILEAVRRHAPGARFYQASSSEMFGASVDDDDYQRETTRMNPTSPYGCAKLYGFHITRHFRRAYGMFAANGILFNHGSPRRASTFVEAKIVKTAVQIKRGLADKLVLGNMDSQRDWGDSRDYVRAMWLMLQHDKPDDWLVATGKTRSVRDVCDYVFHRLGLAPWAKYVQQDERYMRPEELPYLRGDASKIRKTLGWRPEYTFERTLDEMICHWETVFDGKDMVQG